MGDLDEIKTTGDVKKGMDDGSIKAMGSDKTGVQYFMASALDIRERDLGSAPTDDASIITETGDDRSVRIHIDRNDEGAIWAFDNDIVVYRSVMRRAAIMNNGYDVIVNKKTQMAKEAKEYIERTLKKFKLRDKYNSIIINRAILAWSPIKKIIDNDRIIGLLELEPKDCNPIRNLATGELGGELGKNVDPEDSDKEVALVQEGDTVNYNHKGEPTYQTKDFYFARNEIMFFTLSERGKFKGVSPVRRALRLVEAKKTIENIVELVCRRFGPQIWVVLGNEKVNLLKTKIPQSYFRSDGAAVTRETAMTNYRNDLFSSLSSKIQKWSTGESLSMMAEYGIEIKVIEPSANLPRYIEFIQMYADFIKNGIFGLDFPGRVDVTSSRMLEKLPRDLEDAMNLTRGNDFLIFNEELINPLLKQQGFTMDSVIIVPKPLDRLAIEREVEVERLKSATVFNYMRSGVTKLPKKLAEKWGFDIPDLIDKNAKAGPTPMGKDQQHPPIRPQGAPGPIVKTSR